MLRIFLVDDSEAARAAVKRMLEQRPDWNVVGEAFDGHHALRTLHLHSPHITVMDFIMPRMNGLEAARHLTKSNPDILILMITTDPSKLLEEEARRAGIRGLCAKNQIHCMYSAIEAVMKGETYFSEDVAA